MSSLSLVTAPTIEPLTLAEAKDHLREDGTDQDPWIIGAIVSAREWIESYVRRAIMTQTWDLTMDKFPRKDPVDLYKTLVRDDTIEVPLPPLISVVSLKYVDNDGATQTLAANKYIVDSKRNPGRVTPAFQEVWPDSRNIVNAVTLQFTAGYGPAVTDVPESIKSAMLLLISHLYENREATSTFKLTEIPMGVKGLLGPYRIRRF